MALLGLPSASSEDRRSTQDPLYARYPRCDLLRLEERLLLAPAPARLPAVEDRLPLLPRVAAGGHLRAAKYGATRTPSDHIRQDCTAQRGHSGFAVGQDYRGGR